MAELEAAAGLMDRPGADGAAGVARPVDTSTASPGGLPGAVVSHPARPEPPVLWDEAVKKFLVVSRRYLFPGLMTAVPKEDLDAGLSRARSHPALSGGLADSRGLRALPLGTFSFEGARRRRNPPRT